jgi:hypothetical protein
MQSSLESTSLTDHEHSINALSCYKRQSIEGKSNKNGPRSQRPQGDQKRVITMHSRQIFCEWNFPKPLRRRTRRSREQPVWNVRHNLSFHSWWTLLKTSIPMQSTLHAPCAFLHTLLPCFLELPFLQIASPVSRARIVHLSSAPSHRFPHDLPSSMNHPLLCQTRPPQPAPPMHAPISSIPCRVTHVHPGCAGIAPCTPTSHLLPQNAFRPHENCRTCMSRLPLHWPLPPQEPAPPMHAPISTPCRVTHVHPGCAGIAPCTPTSSLLPQCAFRPHENCRA